MMKVIVQPLYGHQGPYAMPVWGFFDASAWVCICTTASWQAGRCCAKGRTRLSPGRLPVWSTSWQQLLTDPRVWPATVICAPSPISSQHWVHFRALSAEPCCCEAASWGLNSGNWVVNILKCSSTWVYFTPVIRYFQCVCSGCWTEDYCTYRNYFITVSCCCFCEAITF